MYIAYLYVGLDFMLFFCQDKAVGLKGRFTLDKKQPEYATFATTSSGSSAPTVS